MADKKLTIVVAAEDHASGALGKVRKNLDALGPAANRASTGIGKAAGNIKNLALGAGLIGVGVAIKGLKDGLDSLSAQQGVDAQTVAAIKSTGGAAKISAAQIRDLSNALEDKTTIDNKEIQAAANLMLTFTNVRNAAGAGNDIFNQSVAVMTDMATAMGTDAKGGAIQLGKALNDPVKGISALSRVGVTFDAVQQKQIKAFVKAGNVIGAQKIILKELNKEFGGSGAAKADTYAGKMAKLADAVEGVEAAFATALLPVLSKTADFLNTKLRDPAVIKAIGQAGQALADAFQAVLGYADKIPWGSIADAMRLAGTGAKAVFDAFTSLPAWVQTAVITGWGLNKLTGGAVTGVIGELAKGLIKGVLGINAGVVNVTGAVVNTPGGLPDVVPGGKGGIGATIKKFIKDFGTGILGTIKTLLKGGGLAAGAGIGIDLNSILGPDSAYGEWKKAHMPTGKPSTAIFPGQPGGGPGYTGPEGKGAGYVPPDVVAATKEHFAKLYGALGVLHADFLAQLALLKKGDPKAATQIADEMVKGVGSVGTTKEVIAQLKRQVAAAKDPATRKIFTDALHKVEGKLPGREWIAQQKASAEKIAHSNESVGQKVQDLKAIQRALLAKGDTTAAKIVGALLGSVVPAINGISINVSKVVGGTTLPGILPGDRRKRGGAKVEKPGGGLTRGPGGKIIGGGGRQAGGPVKAGVPYMVGEAGAEMFVPHTAGKILAAKTAAAKKKNTGLPVFVTNWPGAGAGGGGTGAGGAAADSAAEKWHLTRLRRGSAAWKREMAAAVHVHVKTHAHVSAREADIAAKRWKRVSTANGNGVSIS